ncbi:MAG: DnaJ domain-containing protein [Desulfosoma sp.]
MGRKDYYRILGVSRDASREDIRKAYRELVRRHHPDRNEGDAACEERLKEINEAYSVLGDPEKKKAYDAEPRRFSPSAVRSSQVFCPYETQRPSFPLSPLDGFLTWIREHLLADDFSFEDPWLRSELDVGERVPFSSKKSAGIKGPSLEVHIEVSRSRLAQGENRWVTYRVGKRLEQVFVRIPPNVSDGARLRMAGRGGDSPYGGPPGDLYVIVHLVPES